MNNHDRQNQFVENEAKKSNGSLNDGNDDETMVEASSSLGGSEVGACEDELDAHHSLASTQAMSGLQEDEQNPSSSDFDQSLTRNADALLASEMNALSFAEREAIFDDIHCILRQVKESPAVVQKALESLERELPRIRNKQAYDKANFLHPEYVSYISSMFVRANQFKVTKETAVQITQYFQTKLGLFGPDKLVKEITLEDLSSDDKEALMSGASQIIERKDISGRLVLFRCWLHMSQKHPENDARALWYLIMSVALRDRDAQQKGMVIIMYILGNLRLEDLDLQVARLAGRLVQSLPIRIVGFHVCYNDQKLEPLISLAKIYAGFNARVRLRTHFGSHMEVQYELMRFGIPREIIPIDKDGNLIMKNITKFLEERQKNDGEKLVRTSPISNPSIIKIPRKNDVLLGRGKPYQSFEGNLRWAGLIDAMLPKYQVSEKGRKKMVADEVIERIHEDGGRFLKRSDDENGWVEVNLDIARDKTRQGFRARIRALQGSRVNKTEER